MVAIKCTANVQYRIRTALQSVPVFMEHAALEE